MPRVRSFDVFDTVVTRLVGGQEAFLSVLADRVAAESGLRPAVVCNARARAERFLTHRDARQPALADIWRSAAESLNLPESVAARWTRIEEDLMQDVSVPAPGVPARLDEARRHGDLVIFVADTPYSADLIRGLLERLRLWRPGDGVFTSADEQASKTPGDLYRRVGARLGAEHTFLHTSSRRGEVGAARIGGWSALRAPQGRRTRYERHLQRHDSSTDHLASWLAGASRLARLEAGESGLNPAIAGVSSAVMSSFLIGYVLWLAGQAKRDGIERLYFVARDGKVILRVAEQVLSVVAPELELRYLYASRQPWTLTASATSDEIRRAWISVKPGFTARSLLARVEITPEEAFAATGLGLFRPALADQALTPSEREAAAEALQAKPLLDLVLRSAEAAAEVTNAYLRQEGFVDGKRSALVDTGWTGRTSAAFDHIIQQLGGTPVSHYLTGLIAAPPGPMGAHVVPWLFDQDRSAAEMTGFWNEYVLVGMFCAGLEGRTLAYRMQDGRVEPVLAAPRNEEPYRWGLQQAQDVAVRAAELIGPRLTASALHIDSRPFVWDVLRLFWLHPTTEEVEAWGSYPYEQDTWPPFHPIAQRVTTTGVMQRLRGGGRRFRSSHTWRAGTRLVSAQPWRALMAFRVLQEDGRARLRRLPRRVRLELAARDVLHSRSTKER